uniref:SusC/RagA family TonB-linked outer membrane protein n=1 Tax=Pedobacter schmidteae TaxID=2201271 RepID=UPI0013CE766B|nr:SusC/RagA family TonB-linked outer membrane protein [Pedobacter schmidteae]
MRLTVIIIIASMLQVSASTYAQKLSYVKKDITLAQLFKEIKKQTSYNVVWVEKKLDVDATINANFKNVLLAEVFDQILDGQPLSYTISDKTITIKEKELSLTDKIRSLFATIDVRGRVLDEKNEPLVGAVVKVKGTKQATSTNSKGEFLLKNVDEKAILEISFLGYEHQEIKATEKIGDIKLVMSEDKLQEVQINAGYYTVTERERTGSISKITAKEIGQQPVNNPLLALVGRVPGLQITQQTGMPGGGVNVQIRGRNSIAKGNDPLYIVDGVNYASSKISAASTSEIFGSGGTVTANPLSFINPNDIESIEVLKDADATAIYGSRGANGVILITTKKGSSKDTKVNVGMSQGVSEVGHRLDLLNTEEYLQMRKEAFNNDKLTPGPNDYDLNGTWDQNKYTDWQEVLIGGKGRITNALLNINGGNDKSSYLIGGAYYKEGTVFSGNFGFERASIRSSINLGSEPSKLSANFTINYSYTNSNLLRFDPTNNILLAPNYPDLYDQYGKLNWSSNIVSNPMSLLLQTNNSQSNTLIGNFTLKYQLVKNLFLKTSLGYNILYRKEQQKQPLESYSPALNLTPTDRIAVFSNNYANSYLVEPQISYDITLGKGIINALLGSSFQRNSSEQNVIQGSGYNSDDLMGNTVGAALLTNLPSANSSQYRYAAVFGRLNYSLSNKYFLNLTVRRDGSSRFGEGKRFANFGAIGAAWIFSDEKIFKDNFPFLSLGKLRASYGITGNDQIGDYNSLEFWNPSGTYQGKPTVTPGRIANPDLVWEKNRKAEVSLQFGFLNNKIDLNISYYRNVSSNQLIGTTFPLSVGTGGLTVNLPAIVKNTGWEFDSNINLISGKNLKWSTGLNLTIPKNKLVAYPGLETSTDAINYQIGQPLSIFKTYRVTVNQQTGLYIIEDKNLNNVRDDADRFIVKFLGQYFYGGMQNNISFKQFKLGIFFSFAKQNGRSYRTSSTRTPGGALLASGVVQTNQFSEVLDRWQKNGDDTSVQRFTTVTANNSLNTAVKSFGDLSIVDASYIKLRNLSLGYTLPQSFLTRLKISNAMVTIQGQNIFTFTSYKGLDPETQGLYLPPLRTLTLGLNLTF